MTDKDRIKAEIDRLQGLTMDKNANFISIYTEGKYDVLCELEAYIDSMQKEPVSEDLEKFATELANEYFPDESNIWARPNYEARFLYDACIRTAQWQKEQIMKQLAHMPWDKVMDYIVKEAEK